MEQSTIIDYTKFRLKPEEEIREVLKNLSGIFVICCNKCFKEFDTDSEPECKKLLDIVEKEQVQVTGSFSIDFLCNHHFTKKILAGLDIKNAEAVGVISCGLGIQVVSQLFEGQKRVFALADSIPQSGNATSIVGYHGMALGAEKCAGCAQCYLNITGGLCPVVNCAKSLLNGPCGGANDGKCEVNPEKDCVWEQIYKRLKEQGRSFSDGIHIRDYNKFNIEEKNKLTISTQTKRNQGFYGGIYPLEKKEETQNLSIKKFPEPEQVAIFLSQHTGSPAQCLVKPGDNVKVGQKVGESTGFISSSVHSSISGKVIAVEERIHPALLKPFPAVIIENDGSESIDPSVEPVSDPENLSKETLTELLKEKGIVGLGGAMFPTHVKLCPPKSIDTLLLNGCECEPFLSGDNRIMIEHPEEIFKSLQIIRKILNVENVIVGVEENKPEAIETLKKYAENISGVSIVSLQTKYPQGAEKMLIKKVLERKVSEGGLPLDVGVVVLNVSTVFAIYQAVYHGQPLIQRVVTISGEGLKQSGNFVVKIGTLLEDIIQFCFDGDKAQVFEEYEVKMGGPMMGISQENLKSGIIKGTTGFTFLKKSPVEVSEERECIKCGRCVEVCPMELHPLMYVYYGKKQMWDESSGYKAANCIECGACQYICSSKIDILSFIKKAKRVSKK